MEMSGDVGKTLQPSLDHAVISDAKFFLVFLLAAEFASLCPETREICFRSDLYLLPTTPDFGETYQRGSLLTKAGLGNR